MSDETVKWFQGPSFCVVISRGSAACAPLAHCQRGSARLTAWNHGVLPGGGYRAKGCRARVSSATLAGLSGHLYEPTACTSPHWSRAGGTCPTGQPSSKMRQVPGEGRCCGDCFFHPKGSCDHAHQCGSRPTHGWVGIIPAAGQGPERIGKILPLHSLPAPNFVGKDTKGRLGTLREAQSCRREHEDMGWRNQGHRTWTRV